MNYRLEGGTKNDKQTVLNVHRTMDERLQVNRKKKWKRIRISILVILIIFFTPCACLILCTPPSHSPEISEEPTPDPGPCKLVECQQSYAQEFHKTSCPFTKNGSWNYSYTPEEIGIICGNIDVPLHYDKPGADMIQIPIAIIPARSTNPAPDPLFLAQGGPGGSSLDLFPYILKFSTIGIDRDLVIVDQRGTRHAQPSLVCPEELVTWTEDSGGDEGESSKSRLQTCYERLQNEGVDLSAFNSPQIAEDIERVRQVLGYEQINFYGVSYGSHLGQYLMAFHPDSLRSVILDGVTTIPLDWLNDVVKGHESLASKFFLGCSSDAACALQYPDLKARFLTITSSLNETPLIITYQDPESDIELSGDFTGRDLMAFFFSSFYMDNAYAIMPYIITKVEQGDLYYFKDQGEQHIFAKSKSSSSGLFHSVVCGEHLPFLYKEELFQEVETWLHDYEHSRPESHQGECDTWKMEKPQNLLSKPIQSNIPALLLSGNFDPVTPPENAEEVLVGLENGFHIIDPIGSHGVAFSDSCTKSIVHSFLNDPNSLPNTSCLSAKGRRNEYVQQDAIHIELIDRMLQDKNVLDGPLKVSVLMLLVVGGSVVVQRQISKRRRQMQEIDIAPGANPLIRRLFKTLFYFFILGSFGHALGFNIFFYKLVDENIAYLYALALRWHSRGRL